MKYVKI